MEEQYRLMALESQQEDGEYRPSDDDDADADDDDVRVLAGGVVAVSDDGVVGHPADGVRDVDSVILRLLVVDIEEEYLVRDLMERKRESDV